MIDMAFAKKRVDDRKLWLLALEPGERVQWGTNKLRIKIDRDRESHESESKESPLFW